MKRTLSIVTAALVLGLVGWAGAIQAPRAFAEPTATTAEEKTLTFGIENMTCAMCPVTVRKAIEHVDGVASVEVDFEEKTATVVFNPDVTTPKEIAEASTNIGYPASQIE